MFLLKLFWRELCEQVDEQFVATSAVIAALLVVLAADDWLMVALGIYLMSIGAAGWENARHRKILGNLKGDKADV